MAKSSTVYSLVPGLVLCALVMVMGILGAEGVGYLLLATGVLAEGSASPISGIFVAIILGILIRNFLPLPDTVAYGVGFAVQYALRAGIILLGFRLSLTEAVKLGVW
ncbi:MAG TPA: putative sulfate exporter family transporter, partial [Planococcus sp. (in: firmicutes)]|nr:putative sulfate exporter family transporter [Planococcus sp. (in: firmicutes)]